MCNLVDRPGSYLSVDEMVTRKAYNKDKRCGANGTGKDQLKILYQNGGNVVHTYGMIRPIEKMMNNVRPHVMYMAENRMDDDTRNRLTNIHNFTVEELGPGERIWAAVRNTVPYRRMKECEDKGICALWLEFGTGNQKYVVIGAYREHTRIGY